ncbi:MAG: hypothetical protein CMP38_06510 [Rickettsiales bacterium]|nr:hypothetical protein [Rickettsiales bacterium]|tara:strand:+ start:922 stop:1320 length:399 start_codon:yes stop_codon:yes gene_type:complete
MMKVVLQVIMYFLISFPCYSKWEKVHEDKVFTEYFELATVKKINEIIYIWSLKDYKEQQKNGSLSTKYYSMYDCNQMRYKVLSIIEYKTNMGKGRDFRYTRNITNELSDANWIYPSLDNADYIKINTICSPS